MMLSPSSICATRRLLCIHYEALISLMNEESERRGNEGEVSKHKTCIFSNDMNKTRF